MFVGHRYIGNYSLTLGVSVGHHQLNKLYRIQIKQSKPYDILIVLVIMHISNFRLTEIPFYTCSLRLNSASLD